MRGARMALCSGSIGVIDGIVPPARAFRAAGGLVALGSDQASGNNCNNIFNEMKLTALLNKCRYRDPTIMPAWEVLRMATIEGAQAIGLGDEVGSLEPDKQADLILVGLTALNLSPVLEAPIRQAWIKAAQPGLRGQRARGQDGDRGKQGARARW